MLNNNYFRTKIKTMRENERNLTVIKGSVMSASSDNTIRLWNSESDQCLKISEGHASRVLKASFSFDGSKVVTASWDQVVRI
mmetsp:Transcript_54842/g.46216  ORF Transcript_54842/g.46216 Transcript_54842/m.46216 type:complete len:82 (-) Transcript_54842:992-1237(-)